MKYRLTRDVFVDHKHLYVIIIIPQNADKANFHVFKTCWQHWSPSLVNSLNVWLGFSFETIQMICDFTKHRQILG